MLQLNLPFYQFRVKKQQGKDYIFDNYRKKYVKLTPEEWVRQHFVRFLIEEKHYPPSLIALEQEIALNGLKKRCDAVVYNKQMQAQMILEFKAPEVKITQATFEQILVYNKKLNVSYLMVSNGLEHYCCNIDIDTGKCLFLNEIPEYGKK